MSAPTPSPPGAVVLLGGTGKIGSRIAALLETAGIPSVVASRSGALPAGVSSSGGLARGVRFDWTDESTWEAVLAAAAPSPIRAVFVIEAPLPEQPALSRAFVDRARGRAPRFVLLSASAIPEGGPLTGQTHRYLRELGDAGAVEWAVLRPTWFQENFLLPVHSAGLVEDGLLHSATRAGRIPWVSADDIAAVGFHALTVAEPPNTDFLVLGPELLTYNDLAATFTAVLGRPVAYQEIDEAAVAARFVEGGMPETYAKQLAALDVAIRDGLEEHYPPTPAVADIVRRVTGREPRPFRDYVEANQAAWSAKGQK
ncbi:putative ergot alkaloid A [Durotheca rogersii]|uniref:putative ergot alkaloid A n=1 Tax=Durotheca rogersii TaxID=419775 RepID=UPI00221FF86A|nr:putative ergot alkaloid A [Durotheca rogersii]KAI5865856.1 putative ergot alkaloid A [Durotheca rogersii]